MSVNVRWSPRLLRSPAENGLLCGRFGFLWHGERSKRLSCPQIRHRCIALSLASQAHLLNERLDGLRLFFKRGDETGLRRGFGLGLRRLRAVDLTEVPKQPRIRLL